MKELKKINVYLIAGQSNAVGCTSLETLSRDFCGEIFDKVTLYHEGNFCPTYYGKLNKGVRLGMGCDTASMGIEYGISKILQERNEESALIRYALGGSTLYYDWKPRYLWGYEPQFIGQCGFSYKIWAQTVVNGLNKLIEAGYIPQIKALAWMQGESDADKTENIANDYLENLHDLFLTMRAELRIPDLPIIIGEIATQKTVAPWSDTIRAAQAEFVKTDNNAMLISTKDIPIGKDAVHFDAPEDFELGKRFGRAFLEMQRG